MPISVPAGAIRHTGGCLQPVLLRGRADYIDSGAGELIHRYTTVHEPGDVLPIAVRALGRHSTSVHQRQGLSSGLAAVLAAVTGREKRPCPVG